MESKMRYCSACQMLARGVKFRKSPTHTCDKFKPKTFKIPKVDEGKHFRINIQRGGIQESPNAIRVRCIKQEIEGVLIPNGFEIWLPGNIESVQNKYSHIPYVYLPGWKLNEVLKFLVMEGLRNG